MKWLRFLLLSVALAAFALGCSPGSSGSSEQAAPAEAGEVDAAQEAAAAGMEEGAAPTEGQP